MLGGAAIGAGAGAIVGNNSSSIDQGQAIMMGASVGSMAGGFVGGLGASSASVGANTANAANTANTVSTGGAMTQAGVQAADAAWNAGQASLNTGGFMASMANNPMMTASMLGGAMNIASAFTSSSGSAPNTPVKMPAEHQRVLKDLKQSEEADRKLVQSGGLNNMARARIGQFSKQLQESQKLAEKRHAVVGTQSSVEGSSMSGKSVMAGLLNTTEAAGSAQRLQGLRREESKGALEKNLALSGNIANIESQTPYLRAQQDVAGQRANIMNQQRRGGAIAGGLDMLGMASYYNTRANA
jgi:hypothetical protein